MNGGNRSTLIVRDKDRHAVGSLNGQGDTTKRRDCGVAGNGNTRRRCIVYINHGAGMNLLQLDDRPTRRADRGEESRAIHLNHRIRGVGGAEREIIAFRAARGKRMDQIWSVFQDRRYKERYLIAAFYLEHSASAPSSPTSSRPVMKTRNH